MRRRLHQALRALGFAVGVVACSRAKPNARERGEVTARDAAQSTPPRPALLAPDADSERTVAPLDDAALALPALLPIRGRRKYPAPVLRQVPFADGRAAFVVMPAGPERPARLLAMIHGACTPPSNVCGAWKMAASEIGLLVCPVGNTTCGAEGTGPPTWEEPFPAIDVDLERSIDAVRRAVPVPFQRDDAVLAGYSRGAYVAVTIAVRHPGRWPFLLLNEADVELTVPMLRAAGVRAVALIAGEWGTQIVGERRTVEALTKEGYPARLWVMPRTGHPYSPDIDSIMADALRFLQMDARSDAGVHLPPTPTSVP